MSHSESTHPLASPRTAETAHRELIHLLNRRYQEEHGRAERLRAELDGIVSSRAWKLLNGWTNMKQWLRTLRRSAAALSESLQAKTEKLTVTPARPTGRASIIIPFKDRQELLRGCLRSLATSTYRRFEIVLVDNGSSETRTLRYLERLRPRRRVRIIHRPGSFNFSRLCNAGARAATGEFLLFLNNDTELLTPDWLEHLLLPEHNPEIGIVGATLLYPNNTIQHAGIVQQANGRWIHAYRNCALDCTGAEGELRHVRTVPAVTGACLLIGRDRFFALGGFDERYTGNEGDVDLCRRIRDLGLQVVVTPHARLIHYESLSRGYSESRRYSKDCKQSTLGV